MEVDNLRSVGLAIGELTELVQLLPDRAELVLEVGAADLQARDLVDRSAQPRAVIEPWSCPRATRAAPAARRRDGDMVEDRGLIRYALLEPWGLLHGWVTSDLPNRGLGWKDVYRDEALP